MVFFASRVQTELNVGVILAAGKNTGLKLPGMALTLPDVYAGVHALEYPISSGAIIDYSLRGEPFAHSFESASTRTCRAPRALPVIPSSDAITIHSGCGMRWMY